ncbi:uncharacterized protein BJ171DRAFT_6406 [Polychytrium aggregatum]|uniref:uncharacterized protein n=1 Tax=Polychytrium aggregatum TaxID=110093 RepID=UPI0022FE5FA2|nr:uncharacterized protein BJ171DRAFT_6406 [Polychytrium aggregatum]KAI9209716.1 hypothetical protein BJ171DRAFT_6406 [Polychytrium aggregatum]
MAAATNLHRRRRYCCCISPPSSTQCASACLLAPSMAVLGKMQAAEQAQFPHPCSRPTTTTRRIAAFPFLHCVAAAKAAVFLRPLELLGARTQRVDALSLLRRPADPAMAAVVPINPTNVQWFVDQGFQLHPPQCSSAGAAPTDVMAVAGDQVLATNRCRCNGPGDSSPGRCQYSVVQTPTPAGPANGTSLPAGSPTILTFDCGTDTTCQSGCTLAATYSTASQNPCDYSTRGRYGALDYTSATTWDSGFKTNYFYYSASTTNDATCVAPNRIRRYPVYPTCTQILDRVFALSILGPSNRSIGLFTCYDSGCNSCVPTRFSSFNRTCTMSIDDSEAIFSTFSIGAILNDPSVALQNTFPNQTAPSWPSTQPTIVGFDPDNNGSSRMAIIGGIVGGFCALLLASIIAVVWYRARLKQVATYGAIAVDGLESSSTDMYRLDLTSNLPAEPPAPTGAGSPPDIERHRESSSRSQASVHTYGAVSEATVTQSSLPVSTTALPYQAPGVLHEVRSTGYDKLSTNPQSPLTLPPKHKFVAVVDYNPSSTRQLALRAGDVVFVHDVFTNGYAPGGNARTGAVGLISEQAVRPAE